MADSWQIRARPTEPRTLHTVISDGILRWRINRVAGLSEFQLDAPNLFMYSMRDIAMQAPPFKLATAPSPDGRNNYHPLADLCCAQSDKVTQVQTEVPREVSPRARLIDLDPIFHCSVIGTCLSTGELRKLVPRLTGLDRERASDLEIHHAAVQMAGEGGLGAKALNKALEARFESTLKQYNSVKTEVELRDLWRLALKNGEVPAAYWAAITRRANCANWRSATCICCRIWSGRPIGPIFVGWSHLSRKTAN